MARIRTSPWISGTMAPICLMPVMHFLTSWQRARSYTLEWCHLKLFGGKYTTNDWRETYLTWIFVATKNLGRVGWKATLWTWPFLFVNGHWNMWTWVSLRPSEGRPLERSTASQPETSLGSSDVYRPTWLYHQQQLTPSSRPSRARLPSEPPETKNKYVFGKESTSKMEAGCHEHEENHSNEHSASPVRFCPWFVASLPCRRTLL